ncbi:hypothetical protein IEQ34_017367 [Dendrobium chrysotoxum]|uniref:Uncharacterized protein n=1 Tax=Dendrobium chrysotoxum TaxID=161865 RepID=A0AAV7GBH3_DENCH|nr:hypothetical protein IEQ34_017367 [Dendrobium chrysotoxum]
MLGNQKTECLILYPHLRKYVVSKSNQIIADNEPIIVRDSNNVPLNDQNNVLDNVHLLNDSLVSLTKTLTDGECLNNNVVSHLITPFITNSLKSLESECNKLNKSDPILGCKHLMSSSINTSMPIDGYVTMGNIVAFTSNLATNSNLHIDGLDVSNSIPIIDLPISLMLDVACINLEHDPVDHSNWMEDLSGNK